MAELSCKLLGWIVLSAGAAGGVVLLFSGGDALSLGGGLGDLLMLALGVTGLFLLLPVLFWVVQLSRRGVGG